MIKKIYNFFNENEELFQFLILLIFVCVIMCSIVYGFNKALIQERQIIENTKDYQIFDNCKSIDNKFYCWNEEKK